MILKLMVFYILGKALFQLTLELLKMNQYRTPKDKMTVLINFTTIIMKSIDKKEDDKEYIPYIVYYLIKSQPMMMKSTLRFIKLFRNNDHFKLNEERYYNLISSAVDYIEKINFGEFRMTQEEFESKYSLNEKLCKVRFEEQLGLWRYGPMFIDKEQKSKSDERSKTIKELQKIIGKTRKLIGKDFGKLTVTELKEIVETQEKIIETLKNVS